VNDFPAPVPGQGGSPTAAEFLPDIALSATDDLVAVSGFGLHVYEASTGAQRFPEPAAMQLVPKFTPDGPTAAPDGASDRKLGQ
jgi:hypothetical protein